MILNLKYPPTPEAAPQHAALIVETAREVSAVDLDYSIASLEQVDRIIGEWHEEGVPEESIGSTLFGFGCYVGEVFVRHAGARWVSSAGTEMERFAGFDIVLQMGSDGMVNPIGKVFKRLANGTEDNLPYFYTVFAGTPAAPAPTSASGKAGFLGRLFGRFRGTA